MTTYDLFGGGLTVREELHRYITDNYAHYLETTNFAIQAQEFCSVYNLVGLAGGIDGQSLQVSSYYNDATGMNNPAGGGFFLWDSTKAKSSHNGVTVISPTVPWTGTQATLSAFIAGTGETDPSGNGCWVRRYYNLDVMMGGAVHDGSSSDLVAFQAVVDALPDSGTHVIHVPDGSYAGALSSITLSNRKIVWLEQGSVTYVTSNPTGFRNPASATYLNSVSQLVGFSGTALSQRVDVGGYYPWSAISTKLKGGGTFFWDATQAKSNHNGITIISPTVPWDGTSTTLTDYHTKVGETDAAGSGCWVRQYTKLDVAMAGAVGNGVTSDSAVVQRCVNLLAAIGGGVLNFPYGTYNFTSLIEITTGGIYLEGEGWEAIITRSTDYGDTFYIHGDNATGAVLDGFGISNMFIRSTALTTSGAHLHTNGLIRSDISKLYFRDGFVQMQLDGTTQTYITDIFHTFTSLYGGSIVGRRCCEFGSATGAYAHTSSGGVWMSGFQMRAQSDTVPYMEYALHITAADGLWFSNGHAGNASIANIAIRKTTADICNLVYMDNVMCDVSGGSDGMLLDSPSGGTMVDLKFNNHTLKGGGLGNIGLNIAATCNAYKVKFSDLTVSEYTKQGILISSSNIRDLEFDNGDVYGNSYGNTGTYAGIELATGVRDVKFLGGSSGGHNSSPSGAATQSYGIKTSTGHSNVTINGMDLTGNVTGEIEYTAGNGVTIINCETATDGTFSSVGKHILGAMSSFNDATGNSRQHQVLGGASFSSGQLLARFSNDANSPALVLGKSRNDTVGSHTIVNASDEIGKISFEGSDGTNLVAAATIRTVIGGTPGTNDMPGTFLVSVTADGSATPTERLRINSTGFTSITGSLGLGVPVTKTGDFTVATTENFLINNKAGSACVVTLPTASSYDGRMIRILNYQAQTVDSASSNVVPITGGAAGTAIIAATAGKWVTLVSDGTNWLTVEGN